MSEQNLTLEAVKEERKKVNVLFGKIERSNIDSFAVLSISIREGMYNTIQELSDTLSQPNTNSFVKKRFKRNVVRELRENLITLPQNWLKSQSLLYGYAYLESWLMSVKSKIATVYINLWQRIDIVYENKFISTIIEFRQALLQFNKNEKSNSEEVSDFLEKFGSREDLSVYFRDSLNETGRKIQQSTRNFPETVEVIQKESFYDFENLQFDYLKTLNISASQLLNYIVQTKCIEPLSHSLGATVGDKVRELNITLKEVVSSVSFIVNGDDPGVDTKKLIEEHTNRLIEMENEAKAVIQQVDSIFYSELQKLDDLFSISAFTRNTYNLKHYVWSKETKKQLNLLKETAIRVKRYFDHLIGQIWYRQSSGVIQAGKLIDENSDRTDLDDILNMIDQVKIKQGRSEKIPFYYSQLYLSSQSNLFEFWVGRKSEMDKAEKSIKRFREGRQGGIMITGDRKSGKTFFVQKIIHSFLDEAKVYFVIPPAEGNPDKKLFRKILSDTFESDESPDVILDKLSDNSIIVFDDFEFFYERSLNGLGAVNELLRLIAKFGQRHLFIVNMNNFAFDIMSRVKNVGNYFLNVIKLQPMNAEELHEAVMVRHNSGNYKLRLSDRKNPIPGNWDYARLFSRHFSITNGNVGNMMYSWIANVEDVKDNYILINRPKHPDIQVFEMMNPEWYVVLVQIILHRALSVRKLAGILLLENNGNRDSKKFNELREKLKSMERAGILVRMRDSGLYDIDSAVYPYLIEFFVSKGIL